jgi:hypothetical protein
LRTFQLIDRLQQFVREGLVMSRDIQRLVDDYY